MKLLRRSKAPVFSLGDLVLLPGGIPGSINAIAKLGSGTLAVVVELEGRKIPTFAGATVHRVYTRELVPYTLPIPTIVRRVKIT